MAEKVRVCQSGLKMQKPFHFFTLIKTKMSKKNVIVVLISSSHVQYIKQVIVCLHLFT